MLQILELLSHFRRLIIFILFIFRMNHILIMNSSGLALRIILLSVFKMHLIIGRIILLISKPQRGRENYNLIGCILRH